MFWERETKIRGYLAVFLRELAHLVGDFRSDDLRNGFAVDYGGHLIGEVGSGCSITLITCDCEIVA